MDNPISINNKIKVFISSRCGIGYERYDEVRAELKKLIESTNIADVYLFETNGASTQTAQQDYLYALDDSDVCLFLIDNADDVTPAVMKEISRAKSHPKKSLYLFCSENKQEPTQVQKELVGATGSKYYTVKNFYDFVQQGYQDLINDISRIYTYYCKNRLSDTEFGKPEGELDGKISIVSESLTKKNLKQIDRCKSYIGNIIYPIKMDIDNTSETDSYLEQFLKVIWGEKSIKEFNVGLYLDSLNNEMDEHLIRIVRLRWRAIQSYWINDLDMVIEYLNSSLQLSKEKSMPDWLMQDILIDIRNMERLKGKLENKIVFETAAQIELDEMPKELFYPVIDRYEKSYYAEINKEYIKNQIKSSYSVKFGNNISTYAKDLANIYVTACYYGSLTHLLLIKDKVKDVAFHLCEEYVDWEFRVLLIKFAMLTEDSKKIKEIINRFNNILGKMNSKDSMEVYKFMYSNPIKEEQLKSRLEVFKHLGYYFSDDDYQLLVDEILNEIFEWIENDNRVVYLGELIITSIHENRFRMNTNLIIEICIKIINKKMNRFYDKIFDLLECIDLTNVDFERKQLLKSVLVECVQNEQVRNGSRRLIYVVINLKKQVNEYTKELNLIIQENMNDSDKQLYFLETTDTNNALYVSKYVQVIQGNIMNQGKNGSYSFSGYNPYLTIKNILNSNPNLIEESTWNDVIKVCAESLIAKNLTYSEKVSAIQLIIYIRDNYNQLEYNYKCLYKELMVNKDDALVGVDDFLQKHSQLTLEFNIVILRMVLGELEVIKLIDILSEINNEEDFEKIQCLNAIKNIMHREFFGKLNNGFQNVLIQFVLSLKNHSNKDIRYLAISLLLKMVTPLNKNTILTHLSKTMDYENVYIKNNIINNFNDLMILDKDITNTMLKKSLLDNHYLVREKANRFVQKNTEVSIK